MRIGWNSKRQGEADMAANTVPPAPREPSTVELLQKERVAKVAEANRIDKEIRCLDEDITFLERHPEGDRILKRIAERFQTVK